MPPPAPPCAVLMRNTACLAQANEPKTLMRMMRSKRSHEVVSTRAGMSSTPALLTKPPKLPISLSTL